MRTVSLDEAVRRVWILDTSITDSVSNKVCSSFDWRANFLSVLSIIRNDIIYFSSPVALICEMNSFLSEAADVPTMGAGRRWVDSSGYKGRVGAISALFHLVAYVEKPEWGISKYC